MVHSSLEDVDVQKSGLVLVEVSQKLFTLKHFDRKLVSVVFRQEFAKTAFRRSR